MFQRVVSSQSSSSSMARVGAGAVSPAESQRKGRIPPPREQRSRLFPQEIAARGRELLLQIRDASASA